ncbi:hypothetical protein CAL18_13310 [Bordetella genomosp. 7]|uniref:Lipoprotein n=1 Tax=Bordetella genomosp. 7 TaxID=1416805 RepID=A0A261R0F2_9BORD|nr:MULTISPECIES: hypothetical protein [Bordetella]OZI18090.1 hypothetical protein CAL19_13565 [Bordetella genomosp. 7]OZI21882.1 hypothetical protein CAL18_13310 [Bordetella genomosp. 7]
MKLRYLAVLAAAAVLAGCANVKDVRARDPVFYGSTARTADDYITCVQTAWQGSGTPSRRQPVHNGHELVVDGTMGVEAVLTATTWRGKTDVSLSTRIPRYTSALTEAANLCM